MDELDRIGQWRGGGFRTALTIVYSHFDDPMLVDDVHWAAFRGVVRTDVAGVSEVEMET